MAQVISEISIAVYRLHEWVEINDNIMNKNWKTFLKVAGIVGILSIIDNKQEKIDELETTLETERLERMDITSEWEAQRQNDLDEFDGI
jgi:hypothetical protein